MTHRPARLFSIAAFGLAVGAHFSTAFAAGLVVPKAQPGVAEPTAASTAVDWTNYNARPLTLASGMLSLRGDLVANVSSGKGGKPIWITPNIFYGVTDRISVGIAENPQADFLPIAGGLCLSSKQYCAKVFNYVYPTVVVSIERSNAFELAVHGGVDVQLSPSSLWARGGALLKVVFVPELVLLADPTVVVAATHRSATNQEGIQVPVRLGWQATGQANLGLVGDVNGPLAGTPGFVHAFQVPIGIGFWLSPNPNLDIGGNFTFLNLAGHDRSAEGRTVALSVSYRL